MPFTRGVFVYGCPIAVPPDATREAMEEVRFDLQVTLERLTAEAVARARGLSVLE